MKRCISIICILFLLILFKPITVNAFSGGHYRYDINKLTMTKYFIAIHGWAVIKDINGNDLHNINPEYKLQLVGTDDKGNAITKSKEYNNENWSIRPPYEGNDDKPRDYTKAFFTKSGVYSYPTGNGATRAFMMSHTNNHFYINTDFWFLVMVDDIQTILNTAKVTRVYFDLIVDVPAKEYTVFGTKFKNSVRGHEVIKLGIQNERIMEVGDTSALVGLKFMDAPTKITVAAGSARVQSDPNTFLSSGSDRLIKYYDNEKKKYLIDSESNFTKQNTTDICVLSGNCLEVNRDYWLLYYIEGGNYTIASSNAMLKDVFGSIPEDEKDKYSSSYGYYYYKVKVGLKSQSSINVVDSSPGTTAYIPALWGKPEEGVATYVKKVDTPCEMRSDCKADVINRGGPSTTCPKSCCSLCDDPAYDGSYFCIDERACGSKPPSLTCEARPECSVTSIDKGSCPTGESECCSLCDPSSDTYDKYKNTDFCKNPKKCGEESCDLCQPNSPYYNAYKDTDLCKNPNKCGNGDDGDDNNGGGDDSKCPYDDPQRCYCFYYGGQDPDTCAIYKEKDKSTARKNKCNASAIIEDTFKYPTSGYGDNKFSNDACKISCEEIVNTTFQPQQNLKAGMGYEYPIQVSGTRYCTAQYKNDTWSSDLVKAANNANAAYDKMKAALENARDDDNNCGFIAYETQNPSPTNCDSSAGETLNKDNHTCERTVSYDNDCSVGEYNLTSGNCEETVEDCEYPLASKDRRGKYYCKTGDLVGNKCKVCKDKTIVTGEPTKCLSGTDTDPNGTSEDGGCLLSHNACNSPYYLRGDVCQKAVCSASSYTDWSVAQDHINSHITEASNAKANYASWVKAFNSLISDRSICDSYATSNVYKGSSDISVSYSETQGTMQVSKQKAFTITESTIGGSTIIKTNPKQYDIKEDKSRTLSIGSSAYNNSTISLYGGSYIEYIDKPNVTYYDFWNEKSTASNKLEFSKFYYVQRYTGELSTTISSGYDLGGRRVYTDFYQKSGTQNFSSNFDKIGPNLPLSQDNSMKIKPSSNKLTCSYNVDNRIFPQEGGKNYPSYGSVAFTFRQISLTDPFPNRDPRTNWVGQTIKGYEIYNNDPKYKYYLNPTCMQAIRIYNNQSYGYGSFNSYNPYKSDFLSKYGDELITPNSCK
jgi:hypothetical protein